MVEDGSVSEVPVEYVNSQGRTRHKKVLEVT